MSPSLRVSNIVHDDNVSDPDPDENPEIVERPDDENKYQDNEDEANLPDPDSSQDTLSPHMEDLALGVDSEDNQEELSYFDKPVCS